jgi:hypothetical protein
MCSRHDIAKLLLTLTLNKNQLINQSIDTLGKLIFSLEAQAKHLKHSVIKQKISIWTNKQKPQLIISSVITVIAVLTLVQIISMYSNIKKILQSLQP